MGRKPNFRGNFVRKLTLSNAHCFIRLQIDHPDRALQKFRKEKRCKDVLKDLKQSATIQ